MVRQGDEAAWAQTGRSDTATEARSNLGRLHL